MRRRLVAFLTASSLVVFPIIVPPASGSASAAPVAATDAASCDCDEEGDYVNPKGLTQPYTAGNGDSKSSDAKYQVSASGAGGYQTIVIRRKSDNKQLASIYTSATQWGFSPDEDRFVIHGHGITSEYIDGKLYDLTSSSPGSPVKSFSVRTSNAQLGFSPKGKYFALVYLQAVDPDRVSLELYSAYTGQLRHSDDFKPHSGSTGSDYGTAGFGFSPDDNSFLYAWATSATHVAVRLQSLSKKKSLLATEIQKEGFWRFSPCGSRFALVEQNNPDTAQVKLYRTDDQAAAVATRSVSSSGAITFAATAASHTVTSSDGTEVLAPNTGGCASAPPEWDEDAKTGGKKIGNSRARVTWGMVAWSSAPTSGYRVSVGGAMAYVPASQGRYFDATGLNPGTKYDVSVVAVDEDGNESAELTGDFITSTTTSIGTNEIAGQVFRDINQNGIRDGGDQGINLKAHMAPNVNIYLRDGDRMITENMYARVVDEQGNFRFSNLPDGDYIIAIIGGVPAGTPVTQVFPANFQPYELTVGGGQGYENVNFGMAYAPYPEMDSGGVSLTGATFADDNANGVRDAGEGPASDVMVSSYEVHRGAQSITEYQLQTGYDGGYGFRLAQPGTHTIFAYGADDQMTTSHRAIVVAGPGETIGDIDFGVHDSDSTVNVTLFDDADGDGQRSADEPLLDGAYASYHFQREGLPYWEQYGSTTNGLIELPKVPVGSFELTVTLDDAGWDSGPIPVTVAGRDETVNIEVGVDLGNVAGSIGGVVWDDANSDGIRDDDEDGIGGVEICAYREGDESTDCTHTAEGTGAYSFAGLRPGTWTISTWDWPAGKILTYPDDSSYEFDLEAGDHWTADFGFGIDSDQPVVPAPTDLSAAAGDGRVSLTWTSPESEEADITGFDIQRQAVGGTWDYVVRDHPETSYDDRSVTNGTSYIWRVRSVSDHGASEWSEPASATPRANEPDPTAVAPSAPRSVRSQPGIRSVKVTWNAPVSNGGADITDYVVQYSTSALGGWLTASDGVSASPGAAITGLRHGTVYYVRVAARNQAGIGSWSAIASVKTHTKPSKARKVKAKQKGKKKAIVVRWKKPAANGGIKVTGYIVRYSTKRKSGWKKVVTRGATKATVKKLNKKRYFVRVAAKNSVGRSVWSKVQKVRVR